MRFANAVGTCQIDDLPGCSQIAVSHSVFVLPHLRRQGHGTNNHALRLERMKNLNYDAAVCTVASGNAIEKSHLTKFGWKFLYSFKSSKTGSVVELWINDFTKKES